MKYSGKAICVGDHIDTDAIIPARFLLTTDPQKLGEYCMSGLDPEWVKQVTPNNTIMVAGRNFGCGSSREHAPIAIVGAGIHVVLAHSFARIFYRNAFNMGLIPIELGDDVANFEADDMLEIDMTAGTIANKTKGTTMHFAPLPAGMAAILNAGGLVPFVKNRIG